MSHFYDFAPAFNRYEKLFKNLTSEETVWYIDNNQHLKKKSTILKALKHRKRNNIGGIMQKIKSMVIYIPAYHAQKKL